MKALARSYSYWRNIGKNILSLVQTMLLKAETPPPNSNSDGKIKFIGYLYKKVKVKNIKNNITSKEFIAHKLAILFSLNIFITTGQRIRVPFQVNCNKGKISIF